MIPLLAAFVWGIWHGAHNASLAAVVVTSAAIALLFMFFERETLRKTRLNEFIAPWDRRAMWGQRLANAASQVMIFGVSTAIASGVQGLGYALARFL